MFIDIFCGAVNWCFHVEHNILLKEHIYSMIKSMNLCIVNHSLSNIHLVWESNKASVYEVSIFDNYNTLILHEKTILCECNKNFNFRTGHYIIKVNSCLIHSLIPAICRLSTGGCATLVSGADFGMNRPCILTANHCIPSRKIASQCIAHFENQSVHLMPDIFWSSSPRCKEGGIDYSLIGINTEDILKLQKNNIFPHNLSTEAFPDNIGLMPFFKFDSGNYLYKTVCDINSRGVNCVKYKYADNFPKSSAGASGSPVFGFDRKHNLVIQGLHVAHGKSILIGGILFNVKNI